MGVEKYGRRKKKKKNRIEGHSAGDRIDVQLVYLSHLRCV